MDIAQRRLSNQHISNPKRGNALAVVQHLGAVQSQDYPGSMWSIGLRMRIPSYAEIQQAYAAKQIVRSWPMRGTLHTVPSEDLRWMLRLLTPRVLKRTASIYRNAGVTTETVAKARKVLVQELEKHKSLTRPEIYQAWETAGVNTKNVAGLHTLGILAQEGLICFGLKKGNQQTFVLLDEWLAKGRDLLGEEAIREIVLKYFRGHGPAQLQDLCWWSGLNQTEAKLGIAAAGDELVEQEIASKIYWSFPTETGSKPVNAKGRAYLLPQYDEYGVAYKDRSAISELVPAKSLVTANGFWSAMIWEGQVVGMWRREIGKAEVKLKLSPAIKLSSQQIAAFTQAAESYAEFFGSKLILLS